MSMSNTTMATRRLGRSDLQVSALGMGCWAIGGAMASGDQPLGYSGVDDDEARLALERAVERGVTLFDTADAYGAGHSERLLAPVLAHHPEVLVATKFGNTIDEDRRQLTGRDTTPDYMRKALEGSLRRLSRDQIELYQLHVSDVDDSQALDLVAALEEVVAEGLVRWYGISTDDPARVDLFATGPHCTAVQLQLNVFDDNPAALAACDRHDLAALCRSPLAMGLLGGRYNADTALPPDDIRGLAPDWLRWFTDGRPNADFLAPSMSSGTSSRGTAARLPRVRSGGSGPVIRAPSRCPGSEMWRRLKRTPQPSNADRCPRGTTSRCKGLWAGQLTVSGAATNPAPRRGLLTRSSRSGMSCASQQHRKEE